MEHTFKHKWLWHFTFINIQWHQLLQFYCSDWLAISLFPLCGVQEGDTSLFIFPWIPVKQTALALTNHTSVHLWFEGVYLPKRSAEANQSLRQIRPAMILTTKSWERMHHAVQVTQQSNSKDPFYGHYSSSQIPFAYKKRNYLCYLKTW